MNLIGSPPPTSPHRASVREDQEPGTVTDVVLPAPRPRVSRHPTWAQPPTTTRESRSMGVFVPDAPVIHWPDGSVRVSPTKGFLGPPEPKPDAPGEIRERVPHLRPPRPIRRCPAPPPGVGVRMMGRHIQPGPALLKTSLRTLGLSKTTSNRTGPLNATHSWPECSHGPAL